MESTNSVSIHIRRGDYLLEDEYAGICDVPYYSNAISYIKIMLLILISLYFLMILIGVMSILYHYVIL